MKRRIPRTITKDLRPVIRAKVLARIKKGTNRNDCWIVQPSRTGMPADGDYPKMQIFGICLTVHSWAFLGWNSLTIPVGTELCHSCDNILCANPAHVWLGWGGDNATDGFNKGRRKSPFEGHHGLRTHEHEIYLGRRRIMIRWHQEAWKAAYAEKYGPLPKYLEDMD